MKNSLKKQRGLSLIELMIAVVLGIFITGGTIKLFTNSSQSYRIQENASRLQENGRFAMEFLTRDIRMTDYWGCMGSFANADTDLRIDNNLNSGSIFDNITNAIVGADNDDSDADIIDGTDSITLTGSTFSGISVASQAATASANIDVTDNKGLKQNDVVLVSDCNSADIFQITNNPAMAGADNKNKLQHNSGTVTKGPGNADQALNKLYDSSARIYKVAVINYTIENGKNHQPSLFRTVNGNKLELIEGVEKMQIRYGVDSDADNTPNFYSSSAGLSAAQMKTVVAVRISLLLTSLENNITTQKMPYTIFETTTTPTDGDRRLRRVFTSTIAVRNRFL